MAKIRHRFALGDMDCDNHTGREEQVYIYIHHAQCKHIDIPITNHLREKGRMKEGVLKEYITKWERLDP